MVDRLNGPFSARVTTIVPAPGERVVLSPAMLTPHRGMAILINMGIVLHRTVGAMAAGKL